MSNSDTVLLSSTYICMSRWFVFFVLRYFNFHILPDATCFDVYSIPFPLPSWERLFDPHNINAWRASLCHESWSKISYPRIFITYTWSALSFVSIKCLEREREKKKEKELINSVGSMKVEGSLTYKLEGGKCVGQWLRYRLRYTSQSPL